MRRVTVFAAHGARRMKRGWRDEGAAAIPAPAAEAAALHHDEEG
jgi:hypothetical protein